MIKRTLYFGNPAYLSVRHRQLCVTLKDSDTPVTVPIEDIGVVVADHHQVTLTHAAITSLQENKAVIIWCGSNHMPLSMSLPLQAHDTYTEVVRHQTAASEPLKKQLWKQTIMAKIRNQASVLTIMGKKQPRLEKMIPRIQSGDPDNYEAQAAAIYWSSLLQDYEVTRGRFEGGPNALFNYGYAILRAVIARNLVGSGCLPVLGIHHRNKYNPYVLADDIMEPYRPVVDQYIWSYLQTRASDSEELTREDKSHLLHIPVIDITIQGKSSPLMVGAQRTTASVAGCYMGKVRKILYPEIPC